MRLLKNPLRGTGLPESVALEPGEVATDPAPARALFGRCPDAAPTPLASHEAFAALCGVGHVFVKDERTRMGLGSFKALGATYAIAKYAAARGGKLTDETFVCASAGNHGLSMAAGARIFGARAIVYLSDTVPEAFAERLRREGADVVREGAVYEDSMAAAEKAAAENAWTLLSDSSWAGYSAPAIDVMEGYLIMTAEVADDLEEPPSHVFLQAGVGGLAAGSAAAVRHFWGDGPIIIVVEPDAAPCLLESVKAKTVVTVEGPVSSMGRLDCKTPSHLALRYLAREADYFIALSDEAVSETLALLASQGFASTPSGAAGLAALHHVRRSYDELGLSPESRVLTYLSEGPEDTA